MSTSSQIPCGRVTLNDGNEMPLIGLGSLKQKFSSSVRTALEAGYRLFDTAELYGTEGELGAALEENLPKCGLQREDIFITTKVQIKNENAAEWTEESVMGSLQRLRTKYLDLVLIHYPRDRLTGTDEEYEVNKKSRKEVWQVLEQLKDRGLINSIGVSNYEVYHLAELHEYAKHKPAVNQVEFHPYLTRPTLINYCTQNGIFVQAFSSLLRGNKEILNELIIKKLAEKFDLSPQTILYAFAVCSGIGIIPRSVTPERIRDNMVKVAADEFSQRRTGNRYESFERVMLLFVSH
ncbi:oxidoreductase, aldo/keto reductase family protein [Cooperia oncophora]